MPSNIKMSQVFKTAARDLVRFDSSVLGKKAGKYEIPSHRAGSRRKWAQWYAKAIGNAVVILERPANPKFASWLMQSHGVNCIVLKDEKIDEWSRESKVESDIIAARVIFHEVGHLQVTPGILARRTGAGFAFSCKPASEAYAWTYAFSLLTVFASRYAQHVRQFKQLDNTCAIGL